MNYAIPFTLLAGLEAGLSRPAQARRGLRRKAGAPGGGEPRVGVLKSSPFVITSGQLCWQASGFGSSFLAIDLGDDGSYDITQPAPGLDQQGPTGDFWFEQCVDTASRYDVSEMNPRIGLTEADVHTSGAYIAASLTPAAS